MAPPRRQLPRRRSETDAEVIARSCPPPGFFRSASGQGWLPSVAPGDPNYHVGAHAVPAGMAAVNLSPMARQAELYGTRAENIRSANGRSYFASQPVIFQSVGSPTQKVVVPSGIVAWKLLVENLSSVTLYLGLGSQVSTQAFSMRVPAGGSRELVMGNPEMQLFYDRDITAVWDAGVAATDSGIFTLFVAP